MSAHPVAPPASTMADLAKLAEWAQMDRAVHWLGLAGIVTLFLGTLALTKHLAGPSRLALGAFVLYAFAAVSVMIAAAMDGFVTADVLIRMSPGDPQLELHRALLGYTFRINQAFAGFYLVGSCMAISLWSAEILRCRSLSAGLGWYGLLGSTANVLALATHHLILDKHVFGLFFLAQAIWFVAAGWLLIRSAGTATVRDETNAVQSARSSAAAGV